MREQIELTNEVAAELAGTNDQILRTLEERLDCAVFLRGNVLTLDGDAPDVAEAHAVIAELDELVDRGHAVDTETVDAVGDVLDRDASPSTVLDDVIWRHRGLRVAPRTVTQKEYVDSIREQTITVGIGPAGTGKSFLAVAMAVAALQRREVQRIVLTRPAVEAGERLGFLPGDLMAKVDPYLRPLFDALYSMLEMEKVNDYLERNTIEVAPLAFMRGRAQPVDTPVLTPDGWRPIGQLRVGDLVTGSDGKPTPVLGVYPQGRKDVYRLTTQDGASTRCCAEHLWQVKTASDTRRGKPGRVLETREMIGRLRAGHQRRFELPLISEAVAMPEREVPIDPYVMGILLGDGCLTTQTTPSFPSIDPEVVDGGRGGVITANPVTEALRELGLAGTRSTTKFIPEDYLHNSAEARVALLQGLLDSDGGHVTQGGRNCRIQYTTCSARLRDDVVALVRSLGGVAYVRTRKAEGRSPGLARGRAVHHRADAHVLDIRLPPGTSPFRIGRKRMLYQETGGGRPMRFIDSIEPDGDAECVCIQVGAEDSLYVTEDHLVTHNTLNDAFIIVDEAQNTTPEQMKMVLTRLGFGSKMVVTGDVTQVDLPRNERSGLVVIGDILRNVEGIGFVRFGQEDVVRHKLVQRIVAAYDEHAAREG